MHFQTLYQESILEQLLPQKILTKFWSVFKTSSQKDNIFKSVFCYSLPLRLKSQIEPQIIGWRNMLILQVNDATVSLKGLSHEMDFENVDEDWQTLVLIRAAAGFWIFWRHLWFFVE